MRALLRAFTLGTLTLFTSGLAAHADSFTQTQTFGPGPTDFSGASGSSASFQYFNSNIGTLNSISFSSNYSFQSNIVLTNTALVLSTGTADTQSAAQFSSANSGVTSVLNKLVNTKGTATVGSKSLSPTAFALTGNSSIYTLLLGASTTLTSSGSGTFTSALDTNAADLSAFFLPGGGNYSILLNTLTGLQLFNVGGNASGTQTSIASGTLAVTYNYTPAAPLAVTPEPTSLLLLGTGLLGVAGAVRRRIA